MVVENTKYVVTPVDHKCYVDNLTIRKDQHSILTGKVADFLGQPIPDALVTVYKVDTSYPHTDPFQGLDNPIGMAFTDDQGHFVIIVCVDNEGSFLLDISAPGTFTSRHAKVNLCDSITSKRRNPECHQTNSGGEILKPSKPIIWRRNNKITLTFR